jgi:hypothetical protein
MYGYPLARTWRPGKKAGNFFVIYDVQTNKFCGKMVHFNVIPQQMLTFGDD